MRLRIHGCFGGGALFVALVVAACAPAAPPAEAGETLVACPHPTPADEPTWRLVRTTQFSFCVPADWRQVNARQWRGEGTVTWEMGTGRRVPFVISDVRSSPVPAVSNRRDSEVIGGREVEIFLIEAQGRLTTTATWRSPAMILTGQANDRKAAERHRLIIRTVRFAEGGDAR